MSQDPVMTDGDKSKVILENERVRVLEYCDTLGQRTSMHHHSASVLYALAPFKLKLILGDDRTVMREFKAGEVLWSPVQSHIGESVGTTGTHVLIVELKDSQPFEEREEK